MSTASIALPTRARARIRVLRRRFVFFLLSAVALFALYMLWFRDSSLVAVKSVKVEGTGSGAVERRLDKALSEAGQGMTTLDVNQSALDDAARPFPLVQSVSADPRFPSGLTIHVTERRRVGLIGEGSSAVAVAGDGTILRGLPAEHFQLPTLPLSSPPKGPRLSGAMLGQAQVLGAAPPALLRYVDSSFNGDSGVGVNLTGGVELRFGDATQAAEKWRAAAAVMSDPQLGPLDYVDLSFPGRPAVGGVGHSPPPVSTG
ncbi:MAG: FtsQ-type POTRA domain-containing protein [Actinomycetota bacterium]|nr:FtsQ-type POTRA domain-containing protein [Actinomycetota bacterium]